MLLIDISCRCHYNCKVKRGKQYNYVMLKYVAIFEKSILTTLRQKKTTPYTDYNKVKNTLKTLPRNKM